MSVEKFFSTIAKINSYNSLSVLRHRWGLIIKQDWFQKFTGEELQEINSVKEKKKQQLLQRETATQEAKQAETEALSKSKEWHIIQKHQTEYLEWIDVTEEIKRRKKNPQTKQLQLSNKELSLRFQYLKKYFRFKGLELTF